MKHLSIKKKKSFPILRAFPKIKRYIQWYMNSGDYAKLYDEPLLEVNIFEHRTLLKKSFLPNIFQYDLNTQHNLALALKSINGLIIEPGQTFSFWKVIGAPSRGRGYKKSYGLQDDKMTHTIGGGLSQVSSFIYWMALHTPLSIIERHRHPYDLFPDKARSRPFGIGATCIFNTEDLQLKNNTPYRFQLYFRLTEDELQGQIRSDEQLPYQYEIYEREHRIKQTSKGYYIRHNVIFRKMFDEEGFTLSDEFITENNARMMYRPLLSPKKNRA